MSDAVTAASTGQSDLGAAQGRGAISDLRTPFPLIDTVPAILAADPFLQGLLPVFDSVLAPIISTLDCLDFYFDPEIAPMDMVLYLASWMVTTYTANPGDETVRWSVGSWDALSGWRGTRKGFTSGILKHDVEEFSFEESGGVFVSPEPTDPSSWPEVEPPWVTVTVKPVVTNPEYEYQIKKLMSLLFPANTLAKVVIEA
jgi:phage tail-like protein